MRFDSRLLRPDPVEQIEFKKVAIELAQQVIERLVSYRRVHLDKSIVRFLELLS